ncbi:hypothetical protein GGR50DRAFT_485265 [Xylaria sp. CBS 124048]|nr:hypothetical protein GGR50DRAFT_485265 [Xylaria sp. CBS 124048]
MGEKWEKILKTWAQSSPLLLCAFVPLCLCAFVPCRLCRFGRLRVLMGVGHLPLSLHTRDNVEAGRKDRSPRNYIMPLGCYLSTLLTDYTACIVRMAWTGSRLTCFSFAPILFTSCSSLIPPKIPLQFHPMTQCENIHNFAFISPRNPSLPLASPLSPLPSRLSPLASPLSFHFFFVFLPVQTRGIIDSP